MNPLREFTTNIGRRAHLSDDKIYAQGNLNLIYLYFFKKAETIIFYFLIFLLLINLFIYLFKIMLTKSLKLDLDDVLTSVIGNSLTSSHQLMASKILTWLDSIKNYGELENVHQNIIKFINPMPAHMKSSN